MPAPTQIANLAVQPMDVPMLRPFGIAGGTQRVAEIALVVVTLADGTVGYGEAAPFAAFNGETRDGALSAVRAAQPAVAGEDARALRRIAAILTSAAPASGAARCAIETAVLDALARRAGLPLWAWFGGAERSLVTDVTIPIASVEEAHREASQRAAEGFERLKVKVGGEGDLARLCAVREAAPEAALMLDGNGGLAADAALDLLADLRARAITPILFEQPVPGDDLAGLAKVARRGGVPVAADESVTTAADAVRVASLGAAQVVNVKPMKSGVVGALDVAIAARAAGLGLMIGGMVETRLAMSLSACLAAGLGGFAFVDLDTPLWLAHDPFAGGYEQRGPVLDVSGIEAGHGAVPR